MAPSTLTPNERLLRKRLAARLRQRRCRARKREAAANKKALEEQQKGNLEPTESVTPTKLTKQAPPDSYWRQASRFYPPPPQMPLPPPRTAPPRSYYPSYAPPGPPQAMMGPMMMHPQAHYHHAPPPPPQYGHPHHGGLPPPRHAPMDMYHPHPYMPPPPPPAQHMMRPAAVVTHPGEVPRTISRSPSEGSMGTKGSLGSFKMEPHMLKPETEHSFMGAPLGEQQNFKQPIDDPLMSTEKTAVAAMLSLKSNSSDESSVDEPSTCTGPVLDNVTVTSV